jgi:hypothetical protein
VSQVWWHRSIIPALRRLRQENQEIEASWERERHRLHVKNKEKKKKKKKSY